MMDGLQSLRERISRSPTNRRGYRQYSRSLRRDIESHAARRVTDGASYKEVAGELGLAAATLINWCKGATAKPANKAEVIGFRPVAVQDERSVNTGSALTAKSGIELVSRPVVVLPSGVRIEGISLAELPDFLERLRCR